MWAGDSDRAFSGGGLMESGWRAVHPGRTTEWWSDYLLIEAHFLPEQHSQHSEYSFQVHQLDALPLSPPVGQAVGTLLVICTWWREPVSYGTQHTLGCDGGR